MNMLGFYFRRFINRQRWRWNHIKKAFRLPPELRDVEDPHEFYDCSDIEEAIERDRELRMDPQR